MELFVDREAGLTDFIPNSALKELPTDLRREGPGMAFLAAPESKGLAKEPSKNIPPRNIDPLPPKKLFLINVELWRKPVVVVTTSSFFGAADKVVAVSAAMSREGRIFILSGWWIELLRAKEGKRLYC